MSLSGRAIVVTGGTGFLGTAVCGHLLEAGATLHVAWIQEMEMERFPFRERCTDYQVELTDEKSVRALYEKVGTPWASIHMAGGFAMAPVEEISLADMESMFRLNVGTTFLACREAVRAMRAGGKGGRIVNVAARPVVEPAGGMLAYTTSKAGVGSLTQCLAKEVIGDSILVNAIMPSIMDTPVNRKSMPDADFDSWPKVEEVAETIGFLASPENALMTGTLVPVYGRA